MNFLWGVATSSHQIEGGNIHNDWWAWEQAGNIETGETSGLATDHWNRFEEDLRNAASLGLNTYRFSIEWSRCEPQEGKWDMDAFAWYENLVGLCERLGLVPMCTLHHYTLPRWLAEKGGLTHPHFPDRFKGFVRKVAALLGARIPLWCTLNEPMLLVVAGYMGGIWPPARQNPKSVAAAHAGLLRAHVNAYNVLHEKISQRTGPWKDIPLAVGFAHNMVDFQPLHTWNLREWILARWMHRYYNKSWLDAVMGRRQHFGIPGLLPAPKQVWRARGRKTVDFIGINYYTKAYPCWGPQSEKAEFLQFRNMPVGLRFSRTSDTVSDLGWPVHPQGLASMIDLVSRYRVPIYITENGIADAQDALRPAYLKAHLEEIADKCAGGADIRGYYYWSLIDNFEWIKGFVPRFGLWEVDYGTFIRKARPSAQLYGRIVKAHAAAPGGIPNRAALLDAGATGTLTE